MLLRLCQRGGEQTRHGQSRSQEEEKESVVRRGVKITVPWMSKCTGGPLKQLSLREKNCQKWGPMVGLCSSGIRLGREGCLKEAGEKGCVKDGHEGEYGGLYTDFRLHPRDGGKERNGGS